MAICKCCKEEIQGIICGRCGYNHAINLDVSTPSADEHRDSILAGITQISLIGHTYEINEKNVKDNVEVIRLADAKDIYLKQWWSDAMFGQDISEKIKPREVKLIYFVNGVKKECSVVIQPVQDDRMMSIGLSLDKELCLTVSLGRAEKNAKSEKVKIVLI